MTLAWHFVGATLRDGRPIPADGEWLEHVGRIEICNTGLHASRRPAHALKYAPGATLCLVECDGKSFTAAVFAGNETAIRIHMRCTEHDAYFFAPRMKTIAPSEHILRALDEVPNTSKSAEEWVVI
jgi:hypothetical protein